MVIEYHGKKADMQSFQLEEYLSRGTDRIIKGILKASLSNPGESAFMMQYSKAAKEARELRREAEARGEHIPPFLIASITSQCNLHCKGCYARANESCGEFERNGQLDKEQWGDIFSQAEELGIGFILLAGGEPLVRRDVVETAARHKRILFPVFTNGTLMDQDYVKLFSGHRNLIPVFSMEGNQQRTDDRRGAGVYHTLMGTMEYMREKGILFGTSITVTKENLDEVTSDEFTCRLAGAGCKAVVYVEYVPADPKTQGLAPDEEDRIRMEQRLMKLREKKQAMLYISFPGDEKASGGCLAAGRGFFHINADGGAEPCPFSPFSDTSLKETRLREALKSRLFVKLRDGELLTGEHSGGCVLFGQEKAVRALASESERDA